ncbi:hypothetical protein J4Q44_G00277380 [Coregonus suidteri]|uniref:Uncharacterized protein n=1 Tax=Coregonus suidteri TaxID=861788 RepID=A0AAN8QEM8_9TELE
MFKTQRQDSSLSRSSQLHLATCTALTYISVRRESHFLVTFVLTQLSLENLHQSTTTNKLHQARATAQCRGGSEGPGRNKEKLKRKRRSEWADEGLKQHSTPGAGLKGRRRLLVTNDRGAQKESKQL